MKAVCYEKGTVMLCLQLLTACFGTVFCGFSLIDMQNSILVLTDG